MTSLVIQHFVYDIYEVTVASIKAHLIKHSGAKAVTLHWGVNYVNVFMQQNSPRPVDFSKISNNDLGQELIEAILLSMVPPMPGHLPICPMN